MAAGFTKYCHFRGFLALLFPGVGEASLRCLGQRSGSHLVKGLDLDGSDE